MFLIIVFKKKIRNVMHGHFSLNFLVRNTNLKHELKIFLKMFTRRKMDLQPTFTTVFVQGD
jgi:hypothetical protein